MVLKPVVNDDTAAWRLGPIVEAAETRSAMAFNLILDKSFR